MKFWSTAAIVASIVGVAFTNALAQEPPAVTQNMFGIAFGADVATSKSSLTKRCDNLKAHTSNTPTLPIARASETQLICLGYSANDVNVTEAAFIFGDDSLSMIEVYGGAYVAFETLPGEIISYSGFAVKPEILTLAQSELDRMLLMTMNAVHAHMHFWKSPYLPTNNGAPTSFSSSAAQPAMIRFGERSEILRPEFESACAFLAEQHIAEPWLATEPAVQTQLDCFGYVYAGFPRKIEAVFGDGILEQVWILTAAGEEARIRAALEAEYGNAEIVNDTWEVFAGGTVALRKDKPEVLLVSGRVAPAFREVFEEASDE